MQRRIYKGSRNNHTIRIYYNNEINKYEYKTDRFLCNKSNCPICNKHKKNHKFIENNSNFWSFFI